jgi:glycerol uptake facilitator-like aquaporin
MPTTAIQQYSGIRLDPYMDPENALSFDVQLAASATYAKGQILGEVTATPGVYKIYASGNVDGSQNPRAILPYACTTDASGNITLPGEFGMTTKAVPVFFAGTFRTEDLVGLDATGVTNAGGSWKLIEGTVTAGILRIG